MWVGERAIGDIIIIFFSPMCCEEGRLLQNKTVISLLIEFLFNLIWYSFQHDIMLVLVCSLPAEGDWALHILRIMFQNSDLVDKK